MEYLAFFDKDGERITSMISGVHFEEGEEEGAILEFKRNNPNVATVKTISEELQKQLCTGKYLYKDGELIEKVIPEPTKEDIIKTNDEIDEVEINNDMASEETNTVIMETLAEIIESIEELKAGKH